MDIWSNWRAVAYPLGFISALLFSARFIVQWIASESQKKSVVTPLFWQLSFCANLLLLVHAFVQVQWHVALVQACNAVISWRNLDLMQPLSVRASYRQVCLWLVGSAVAVTAAFAVQSYVFFGSFFDWIQIPSTPWSSEKLPNVTYLWHAVGTAGIVLFASRFWVQWWCAEKEKTSYLGEAFWWLSLSGAILSLVYFMHIQDVVNAVGPAVGMVPYIRNLMLLKATTAQNTKSV